MVTWFPTSVGSARIQQHAQGVKSTSRTLKGQQGTSGAPKTTPTCPATPSPPFLPQLVPLAGRRTRRSARRWRRWCSASWASRPPASTSRQVGCLVGSTCFSWISLLRLDGHYGLPEEGCWDACFWSSYTQVVGNVRTRWLQQLQLLAAKQRLLLFPAAAAAAVIFRRRCCRRRCNCCKGRHACHDARVCG